MEGRESESLIVPKKAGNLLDGTRWREGATNHQNRKRETWQVHRNLRSCPRNKCG